LAGNTTLSFPGKLFQWNGGTIDTNGFTLTNAKGSVLNLSANDSSLQDTGSLNDAGQITQTAGTLFIKGGGTLNNAPGGVFQLLSDNGISASFGSGTFNNLGTLKKTAGTGNSFIGTDTTTFNLTFSNTGTVQFSSGEIDIGFGSIVAQISGNTLTAGHWIVSSTSTKPATLDIAAAPTLNTIGSKAAVTLSGPNATFTNLSGLATILKGGSFSLAGGASFTTAGALTNNGRLSLSPASVLTVAGSFTQSSTATLTVQVKVTGSTTTEGEIVTGASGSVTLGGKLVLTIVGSSLPALNVPFTILDDGNGANAISGAFSNLPTEGSTITVNGHVYKVSYVGGDGNSAISTSAFRRTSLLPLSRLIWFCWAPVPPRSSATLAGDAGGRW